MYTDMPCPLCGRLALTARLASPTVVKCRHCSRYSISDETRLGLLVNSPTPEEVANIACYFWAWPGGELTLANIRGLGKRPYDAENGHAWRALILVLHNTFVRGLCFLEFDDPMLLGCTGSPDAGSLRSLVLAAVASHLLIILEDKGTSIRALLTDDAMHVIGLSLTIGSGLLDAFDEEAYARSLDYAAERWHQGFRS